MSLFENRMGLIKLSILCMVWFLAQNLFMLVASERVYYTVALATFEGIYCTYLEFKWIKQSPAKT